MKLLGRQILEKKILHICTADKFIPDFIDLVVNNFRSEDHIFYLVGDVHRHPVLSRDNVIPVVGKAQLTDLNNEIRRSKKIILHGLFSDRLNFMLATQPWVLSRCYWVMWGGDFYPDPFPNASIKYYLHKAIRKFLLKRIGHYVTYIRGDYELVKRAFGGRGVHRECLMYKSNTYKALNIPVKSGDDINILVGNSADYENNHLEVLKKIEALKNNNIKVFCPLSYGDVDGNYVKFIIDAGETLFGNRFVPLRTFLPTQEYLELLGKIDIAMFGHKRQQAMGNTITLLGLGKKVYIRNDVTPWAMFEEMGIKVFDIANVDLNPAEDSVIAENKLRIKMNFSEAELIRQLHKIFEE